MLLKPIYLTEFGSLILAEFRGVTLAEFIALILARFCDLIVCEFRLQSKFKFGCNHFLILCQKKSSDLRLLLSLTKKAKNYCRINNFWPAHQCLQFILIGFLQDNDSFDKKLTEFVFNLRHP